MAHEIDIILDLTKHQAKVPRFLMQREVDAKQLNFTILDNGINVDISYETLTLCIEKPDGEIIYNSITISDGEAGEAYIVLTSQCQSAVGTAKCWVKMVDGASVTYSPKFEIEIMEVTDFAAAVESTSEFSDLDADIVQIAGFEARIGDQQYTEENYVTDDESTTDSIDALDMALKDTDDNVALKAPIDAATFTGQTNAAEIVITSTTKAFQPPRMTTVQRDAIGSPSEGMVVYNTTTHALNSRNNSAWVENPAVTSGSWTPVLYGNTVAGTNTYSTNSGSYYKIGNLVFVSWMLIMTAKDVSMSGTILIGALPFTKGGTGSVGANFAVVSNIDLTTNYTQLFGTISGTYISLSQAGDNVAYQWISASNITDTTQVSGSAVYQCT
jgi:hypothetical protein